MCYVLTFDRAVNQRCTCVNKRKNITWSKRKQVDVMKWYMQMPAAVESWRRWRTESKPVYSRWECNLQLRVGDSEGQSESYLQSVGAPRRDVVSLSGLRLVNSGREAEEVLSASSGWYSVLWSREEVMGHHGHLPKFVPVPVLVSPTLPVCLSSHTTEASTPFERIKGRIHF